MKQTIQYVLGSLGFETLGESLEHRYRIAEATATIEQLRGKLRAHKAKGDILLRELETKRQSLEAMHTTANELREQLAGTRQRLADSMATIADLQTKFDFAVSAKYGEAKEAIAQAVRVAESISGRAYSRLPRGCDDDGINYHQNPMLNTKDVVEFRTIHSEALGLVKLLTSVELK